MKQLARVDIRFLFLIGLLIFLPSVESLKNIFAFLFVVSWVVVAKKNNDWGGKWRVIDSIFLLWILADIFVSINAIIAHQLSGNNFRDIIRFVLIGWVLSRTNFSKERLTQSALVVVVAAVVTLIYGYYEGHGTLKELHSVGHINHTAIYLVITYAISLALLLFNFNNLNSYQKITLVVTTIVLFYVTATDTNRNLPNDQLDKLILDLKKMYLQPEITIASMDKSDFRDGCNKFILEKTAHSSKQFIDLIKKSALVVCSDSGPLHIALALKKDLLAFLRITVPDIVINSGSCLLINKY